MFRDLPSEPMPPLHLDLEKKTLGPLEERYIRRSSIETEEVGGIALLLGERHESVLCRDPGG